MCIISANAYIYTTAIQLVKFFSFLQKGRKGIRGTHNIGWPDRGVVMQYTATARIGLFSPVAHAHRDHSKLIPAAKDVFGTFLGEYMYSRGSQRDVVYLG